MTSRFFSGVYSAAVTAFRSGSVDYRKTVNLARALLSPGLCDGVLLLGSTGEASSLSMDERLTLIGAARRDLGDLQSKIMIGTGCTSLVDTVELTKTAVESGFDKILVLPPFYYKAVSDEGLFRYFSQVIEQSGMRQNKAKMLLYHFPKVAVVSFSDNLVHRLNAAFPDVVLGMKDSSDDPIHLRTTSGAVPTLSIFAGSEATLRESIVKNGAVGCISGTTAITCRAASAVFRSLTHPPHDSARLAELDSAVQQQRRAIAQYPLTAAVKYVVAHVTGDAAWRETRLPLLPMNDVDGANLVAELQRLGCDWSHLSHAVVA